MFFKIHIKILKYIQKIGEFLLTNIREKTALLDKLILSNIIIKDFKDFDKLVKKEIIEVSPTQIQYITASGKMFKKVIN